MARTESPQEVFVMTYGLMVKVPLPIETYEAIHAEVSATQGDRPAPGLLAHFARATSEGYQVVEVWETKEQYDRFFEQVLKPVVERFGAGGPSQPVAVEEFDVRGLITQVAVPPVEASASVPTQASRSSAQSTSPAT
jgi:hypothetical protein